MVLTFYSYGILLKKQLELGGVVEYPIDPAQLAQALATHLTFDTGLLSDDVLLVRREGAQDLLVSYRNAQKTGIWLEGRAEPLRVPLPALLLIRLSSGHSTPRHALFAVKSRPKTLDTPLFHAPLPHIYSSGLICWGNVSVKATQPNTLEPEWHAFLGSPFGNHAVSHKSQRFPQDIRQHWLSLQSSKQRPYPHKDLIPTHKTLRQFIEKEFTHD